MFISRSIYLKTLAEVCPACKGKSLIHVRSSTAGFTERQRRMPHALLALLPMFVLLSVIAFYQCSELFYKGLGEIVLSCWSSRTFLGYAVHEGYTKFQI